MDLVALHPVQRRQAEQPHGARQDVSSAQEQVHPSLGELLVLSLYLEGFPGGRYGVGELEHVGNDSGRLVILHGILDELRITSEEVDNLLGLGFGDQVDVDLGNVLGQDDVGVLSLDRAESDVRVLNVRTGKIVLRGRLEMLPERRAEPLTLCHPRTKSFA